MADTYDECREVVEKIEGRDFLGEKPKSP